MLNTPSVIVLHSEVSGTEQIIETNRFFMVPVKYFLTMNIETTVLMIH